MNKNSPKSLGKELPAQIERSVKFEAQGYDLKVIFWPFTYTQKVLFINGRELNNWAMDEIVMSWIFEGKLPDD